MVQDAKEVRDSEGAERLEYKYMSAGRQTALFAGATAWVVGDPGRNQDPTANASGVASLDHGNMLGDDILFFKTDIAFGPDMAS